MQRYSYLLFSVFCIALLSCGSGSDSASRGPIVLGDPATIVNEADSQYLSDFVVDIESNATPQEEVPDVDTPTVAAKPAPARDTVATPPPVAAKPPANPGAGLNMPFKEVTVFIPGITTRTYRTQNPATSNGVTYELSGGKLIGNKLQISGGSPRISQRYATTIVVKKGSETLELNSLGYTSDWKAISGSGGNYTISGLDESRLEVKNISPAQIRNAVSRAARSKRSTRGSAAEWEKTVRNAKSLKGAPFVSRLRSVMWKIDGKDAKGKSYSKQIRIDIPIK